MSTVDCFQTDGHGNVINIAEGTITLAGHPRVVALASFIVVAAAWGAALAILIWGSINRPPEGNSHDLRRSSWVLLANLWFLAYLTADGALRFLQYHGFTFPIEFLYSELARVKPQGLAEYFCFVAILRCKDVFVIGAFDHPKRWKYGRLFFLVLLTLVDLVSSVGDYYYRISQVGEVAGLVAKDVSQDDCLANRVYSQFKTYADIIFYTFCLVCSLFFTYIAVKFKVKAADTAVKKYRLYYIVTTAAFWTHCIQCTAGTLYFDQFGHNWTQTTETIYIVIYDITMLILLFSLTKLKKLEIDPNRCINESPRLYVHAETGYAEFPFGANQPPSYSGIPSTTSFSTGYMESPSRKFPSYTTSYRPVDQYDNSQH